MNDILRILPIKMIHENSFGFKKTVIFMLFQRFSTYGQLTKNFLNRFDALPYLILTLSHLTRLTYEKLNLHATLIQTRITDTKI